MLEISFRRDELNGREMWLIAQLTRQPVNAISYVVEFLVRRAVNEPDVRDVWDLKLSEIYRLYNVACDLATPATQAAGDALLRVLEGNAPVSVAAPDTDDDFFADTTEDVLLSEAEN